MCNFNKCSSVKDSVSKKSTDLELIQKIKEGDEPSYTILIERHQNYAFTIALRILQNREDAEEIAHDAFIKAFKSIDKFKGESKFTTWFYRIVVNLAISKRRKKQIPIDDIDEANVSHYSTFNDLGGMNGIDRRFFINKALELLNDEERILLTLYYFKELNMDEIEEVTGIDKGNLKVKIFRARKKMAQKLTGILKSEVHSLL